MIIRLKCNMRCKEFHIQGAQENRETNICVRLKVGLSFWISRCCISFITKLLLPDVKFLPRWFDLEQSLTGGLLMWFYWRTKTRSHSIIWANMWECLETWACFETWEPCFRTILWAFMLKAHILKSSQNLTAIVLP